MKNLAKIRKEGFYGTLESTIPPITGPAWLSMATGKNPGKTGVYDFLVKRSEEFSSISAISSYDFKINNPFWDLLNKKGFEVLLNKLGFILSVQGHLGWLLFYDFFFRLHEPGGHGDTNTREHQHG